MGNKAHDFGKKGEQLATELMRSKGYTILQLNYRFLRAEIDILASKNNTLAVVEVKARSSLTMGAPQDFVSKKQMRLLTLAADHFVVDNDLDVEVRFDIVAISKNGNEFLIEHIEDAFYHF